MMNYPFILHHSWLEYKHKNVVVPPVHGDNPTALARGLPYEQVARHGINIYIPHTQELVTNFFCEKLGVRICKHRQGL